MTPATLNREDGVDGLRGGQRTDFCCVLSTRGRMNRGGRGEEALVMVRQVPPS